MRQAGVMAITLPLPLRVAAGIVATGIQLVRSLPEEIPAIPVTLVGNAMKLSMKVQQEITTLATRGDELLGGFLGGQPQENPTWATFDEDTPPARPPAPARANRTPPRARTTVSVTEAAAAPPDPVAPTLAAATGDDVADPPTEPTAAGGHRHTPEATSLSDESTTATEAAAEVSAAVVEAALHAVPESTDEPTSDALESPAESTESTGSTGSTGTTESAGPAADATAEDATADDETTGPAALPGYDDMTLSQVRGHLRDLSEHEVSALLAYEQSGDNRAPFLTLLSNRLVTLGARES